MNPSGKVQLINVDVLENLLVPFISKNPSNILACIQKVDEYIATVFDFTKKFLAFNGDVLLFHLDDLKVLKEVKSYLENYGFQIWMKWVVVNSLPFMLQP
jgi:hypothetical protein